MIGNWPTACSWDASTSEVPVEVVVLILLPVAKIKLKIAAPDRRTWQKKIPQKIRRLIVFKKLLNANISILRIIINIFSACTLKIEEGSFS